MTKRPLIELDIERDLWVCLGIWLNRRKGQFVNIYGAYISYGRKGTRQPDGTWKFETDIFYLHNRNGGLICEIPEKAVWRELDR